MAKVFVSYSRKDIEFAKLLTAELQKSELDFWIDWEGIPPTVDWWKEIEKGIEEADVFLFLISPDSAKSKICGQEIDTAVKNGKRVIPVVVREIDWQDTPSQLGHLNYIFFSRDDDFQTAVNKLITAIQTDYEWAAVHRRLQVRALEWERKNKESSFLLHGKDLQEAELQLATNSSKDPTPTDLQREHVFASRKAADRQRRIITGISIVAAIALAGLAVFGLNRANAATNSQATAEANLVIAQTAQVDAQNKQVLADNNRATALANEQEAKRQATISQAGELSGLALSEQDKHFDLALLLGLEGFQKFQNPRTEGTLLTLTDSHPGLTSHLSGQGAAITSIVFSPDGSLLVSGGRSAAEASIALWDVSDSGTHSMLSKLSVPASVDLNYFNLAISPDGKLLASADDGASDLILWDIQDPNNPSKLSVTPQPGDFTYHIAFSPKGNLVASSSGGSILLWDVSNPVTPSPIATLSDNSNIFHRITFSPDGNLIAGGCFNGTVILWDIADPNSPFPIATLSAGDYDSIIRSITFSPDGNLLAFGTDFGTLHLWDVSNHTAPFLLSVQSLQAGYISSIAFSPDSKRVAVGTDAYSAIVFDISLPASPSQLAVLTGHANPVNTVAFSPDGKRLASGSSDENIIFWDLSNISAPAQLARLTGHSGGINSVAYSANGSQLASAGNDNNIILWDVSDPASPVYLSTLSGHADRVYNIAYSPDSNLLASASADVTAILWDVSNPTAPSKLATLQGHTYSVDSVAFSPDGKILASGGAAGVIILWDVSIPSAPSKLATLEKQKYQINSLAFSPSGKLLASGNGDQTVVLWDVSNPRNPSQLAMLSDIGIPSVTFSPKGNLMAMVSKDIELWDIREPSSPARIATLKGHTAAVWSAAFSPDGTQLASGSADTTIILWDISDPTVPSQLATLNGHTDIVTDVTFSRDGKQLASASYDATLILWNLDVQSWLATACQRVGRNFTRSEWSLYFPNDAYRKTCEQWPLEQMTTTTAVEAAAVESLPAVQPAATQAPAATEAPIALGEPLLQDDFSDETIWGVMTDAASSIQYADGTLQMIIHTGNYYIWSTPDAVDYEDEHLEVTVINNNTDSNTAFGFLCSKQSDGKSYYYLVVRPDGQYVIAKAASGEDDLFLTEDGAWAHSDLIVQDAASYQIGADCGSDGTLTLYVDGKEIASVTDLSYSSGGVGLMTWSGDGSTNANIAFDDFLLTNRP